MKIKNNKTKTKTTIIASLIIGLIMLSPMTVLPNVSAQQTDATLHPSTGDNDKCPPSSDDIDKGEKGTGDNDKCLAKLERFLAKQIHSHPGWIYLVSWNSTSATVDYLGPAEFNPYKANSFLQPTSSVGPLTASTTVNKGVGIIKDTSASGTAIYKEVMDFNSKASNTNSNLYQIVNAMNSNNQHWIQAGLFYDNAGLYGSAAWRMQYDSIQTGGCFTGDFNSVSAPQTVSTGDSIESFIKADGVQQGVYAMGENDLTNNHGTIFGFSETSDTGTTINLGQQPDVGICHYSSGPEEEEQSAAAFPVAYNWGSELFTFGFYDTPTSGKTVSVTGWNTPWGSACVSVSTPPVSPAQATFTATSC